MSPEELKTRIETVCAENIEIIDVKFYIDTKGVKPIQGIVVVYVHRYNSIHVGEDISVWDGDSVEKAILRFIDPSKLKALESDNSKEVTSIAEVTSL